MSGSTAQNLTAGYASYKYKFGSLSGRVFFVVSLFSCPSSSILNFFAPFSSDIIVLVTIPYLLSGCFIAGLTDFILTLVPFFFLSGLFLKLVSSDSLGGVLLSFSL